jgi:redox-sensitive bicupin YhaK (pirin superfamily)
MMRTVHQVAVYVNDSAASAKSRATYSAHGEGAAGQDGARLLLMMTRPLNEPIMRHGPFVMTLHEEIKQAFTDYQNGLF